MKALLLVMFLSVSSVFARVGDTVAQLQKRFPEVKSFGGSFTEPIYSCRNEKWEVICIFRGGFCIYERYAPVDYVEYDRATVEKILLTMSDGKLWEADKDNPPPNDYRSRREGKWSIGTTQAILDEGRIHIYSPIYLKSNALKARRNGVYEARILYDPEEKKALEAQKKAREEREKADPAKGL